MVTNGSGSLTRTRRWCPDRTGGYVATVPFLRVLDLTDELAAYGARLLVGLGADVVRLPRAGAAPEPLPATLHWHAGKRIAAPDELDALAAGADVILESGPLATLRGVRVVDGVAVSRWPDRVHVVVTAFGLTGPQRDWTGDDLVVAAAGGMAWLGGRADGPPRPPPHEQAIQVAGAHAAIGALLGVRAADRDGTGQLIDISAQDATAATLETGALMWIHQGRNLTRNGGVYEHVAHRIFPAADGYVAGGYSGSNRMWDDLVAWLVEAGAAADLTDPEYADPVLRWARRPHVDEVVTRFTSTRSAAGIAEEGRRRALPWAEVAAPADLPANPQLRARDFFVTIDGGVCGAFSDVGFPFAAPDLPRPVRLALPAPGGWTTEPRHRPEPTAATAPALAGVRVLDLTWVLAGPYATKILAEHGADVIKVESRFRQDPTRFAPSMRLRPGATSEDSGYFMNFNQNKRSVAINLRTAEGVDIVQRLAATSDVVIENFSPGMLARWGLDYPSLAEHHPGVVVVSMAGMGHTGPWRDAVTFADTLAALSGLSHDTRDPGGPPQGLTFGLGDIVAANAAVLAVLDYLVTGRGGHVDVAQLEAMAAMSGTTVLAAALGGAGPDDATARWPNRSPRHVPHGTYPTRGTDCWIAVSVRSDEQWRALCRLAGLPALAGADEPARRRDQDAVDAAVAAWTASWDGRALAARLQAAGIAAALVNHGAALVEDDPQLAARGFYHELDHPVAGRVRHEGVVIRMGRTPGSSTRPAPLLGEHTGEVLGELLGVDAATVARLRESEVLR
jgi:crotonobetainyl-CoA:carnitine CoA-transferase CaiB-like acyl-CoA transferase